MLHQSVFQYGLFYLLKWPILDAKRGFLAVQNRLYRNATDNQAFAQRYAL